MYYFARLKDMREDHDKTQAQIAEILGIKQQQYARYENGTNEIPIHHLMTLARYYNLSLDYLTGMVDTPKKLN